MKCTCGAESPKVTETRKNPDGVVCRRRKCACGEEFWTAEVKLAGVPVGIYSPQAEKRKLERRLGDRRNQPTEGEKDVAI